MPVLVANRSLAADHRRSGRRLLISET
jgi:hypothetical protein